jgi:hypothetical protein
MKKIGKLRTYTSKEIENSYVSIDFCCLDRDLFKPEKCYDLLAQTGVKYARCQTGWAKCELEKGVYNFEWLDSVIDNLLERGIRPWFNVGYGNPIYMPDVPNPTAVGCVPLYYGEETLEAWKRYISALAEHYKSRVTHYEIWNEPDIVSFWHPKLPDGAEYAKLTNLTSDIIRKINPCAKIGVSTSTPYCFDFIDKLLKNLDKDSIHVFSLHAYSAVPEFRYSAVVSHLRRRLDENSFEHVELWQGEAGYPSWAYENHWLVKEGCNDERPQAVYQLRRYCLDIFNGLKRSSFFQMADMWEKPYAKATDVIKKPAAHGILNGLKYTPKQSYYTITNIAAIFSGDVKPTHDYIHIDINSSSPIELLACETMTFVKNDAPFYAYYLPVQLGKEVNIPYTADVSVYKYLENPVLIDPYTGEVFEIYDFAYSHGTYMCRNMPLKDYPLILTERNVFEII